MASITPPLHPLVVAAQTLGYQSDVLLSLQAVGLEVDAHVAALAAEVDPVAGLAERDRLVRLVGAHTAGINTSVYADWWVRVVRTLNTETKRLYPDWPTRPASLLLNEWPYERVWP
jgi:hypothetical protein